MCAGQKERARCDGHIVPGAGRRTESCCAPRSAALPGPRTPTVGRVCDDRCGGGAIHFLNSAQETPLPIRRAKEVKWAAIASLVSLVFYPGAAALALPFEPNMATLAAWFWNERFWLPHNVTWADLADPAPGEEHPKARHLLAALPLALFIFAVRIIFERLIARPCAYMLQIQAEVSRRAQPNAVLEKVFTSITKSPDPRRLDGLSKQLDWEVRKVQRWFRHRRNQDKPSTLTKFCESMWRFTFYLFIFTYGFLFLWQSPWMWDTRQCWYNYPYQLLTPGLYYYYVSELAFYWSLMFSQFTDIKRKDFLLMFIHHLATVSLISFSYVNNMVRVGSLVMCVHDVSDFLLEAAKLANYAKYQRLCDSLFVLFGMVFFSTRLIIYPFWVLNSTLFESWTIIGPFPSWWLFNGLLLILQVLHIIWSYFIARIAFKAMLRGKVSKDDRSDIESSSEEETESSKDSNKSATSPKRENGTNGHSATGAWVQDHSLDGQAM